MKSAGALAAFWAFVAVTFPEAVTATKKIRGVNLGGWLVLGNS